MFRIENIRFNIKISILIDLVLILFQTGLVIYSIATKKINFEFFYFSTVFTVVITFFKSVYIFIMFCKSLFFKRFLLGLALLFYILIICIIFYGLIMLSFIPFMGVTSN